MRDATIKLILTGDGARLDQALTRSGSNIEKFGSKTMGVFNRIGRTIQHVGDRMMTPFASIATGAGLAMAGKSVIDFDARLARLAMQAGKGTKDMVGLKKTLLDVSRDTYQLPQDLLSGMEQIVEKTGNFEFALATVKDMGIAASASGAAMESIGAVASNLNEKLGITKERLLAAFDVLNEQGKEGAFTLKQMADQGERMFTAAASIGVRGIGGIRAFGAYIQIARKGTGSSEQATTAVERTIADMIQNYKKIHQITGFSIFDIPKSKKAGRAVFKDFDVIMKEIIKRTKGDTVKLRQIFNEESIRGVDALANSYREHGDFREFDSLINKGGNGAGMMKDFTFWTEQTAAKLTKFRSELSRLANENLAGPIEALTRALDFLNNHPIVTKGGLYTVLGLGGVMALFKGYEWLKPLAEIWGKRGGKGGKGMGLPSAGGGMTIPVYVTNWPGSTGGAVPTGTPGGAAEAAKKAAPWLTSGVAAGGTVGGIAMGTIIALIANEMNRRVLGDEGMIDIMRDSDRRRGGREAGIALQNEINISLTTPLAGPPVASTNDPNTRINLKRGNF